MLRPAPLLWPKGEAQITQESNQHGVRRGISTSKDANSSLMRFSGECARSAPSEISEIPLDLRYIFGSVSQILPMNPTALLCFEWGGQGSTVYKFLSFDTRIHTA